MIEERHAIVVATPGGPEALEWQPFAAVPLAPGQVRVRQHAVGLNFIDVYHRTGLYPVATPFVPGSEGAGQIIELGPKVRGWKVGDRVAYAGALGAYAEERVIAADRLVKLPRAIDYDLAAAIMLKGMTAHYLVRRTVRLGRGHTVLFHAAAGGVGLFACQWARALGATVIGTAGGSDKVKLARAHGCHHVIDYRSQDFVAEVRRITKGAGVDVVYDGVGKDTFMGSLETLRPMGTMVLFGQSSGKVPPLDLNVLSQKGSLYVTRPTLMTYIAKPADLAKAARELFAVVTSKKVKVKIHQRYPLRDAARAHVDLEARKTTGPTVLTIEADGSR